MPPQVSYRDGGAAWTRPARPDLPRYLPPDTLEVRFDEPAAPPARRGGGDGELDRDPPARRLDLGRQRVRGKGPAGLHGAGGVVLADLQALIALDERVAIDLEAADLAGNVGRVHLPLSRFEDAAWKSIYPEPNAALLPGYGVAGARSARGGLCVASYACRTSAACGHPAVAGRLGLRHSADGGLSWTDTSPSPAIEVNEYLPAISALAFDPSGEHGLLVGEGLILLLDAGCRPTARVAQAQLPTALAIYSVAWDGAVAWLATAPPGCTAATTSADLGERGAERLRLLVRPGGAGGRAPAGGGGRAIGAQLRRHAVEQGPARRGRGDLYTVARMPDGTLWAGGVKSLVYSTDGGLIWSSLDLPFIADPDWGVGLIRASADGPFVRYWDGYEEGWYHLGNDGVGFEPWSTRDAEGWIMMDVVPLDAWALFGIGARENPWGTYKEWISFTVSGGN
jgi:hypothetical protein